MGGGTGHEFRRGSIQRDPVSCGRRPARPRPTSSCSPRYVRGGTGAFAAVVQRYGGLVLGVARRQWPIASRPTTCSRPRSSRWPAGRPLVGSPAGQLAVYTVALRLRARRGPGRPRPCGPRKKSTSRRPLNDPLDEISGRNCCASSTGVGPAAREIPTAGCCAACRAVARGGGPATGLSAAAVKGRLERGRHRWRPGSRLAVGPRRAGGCAGGRGIGAGPTCSLRTAGPGRRAPGRRRPAAAVALASAATRAICSRRRPDRLL